MFVETVQLLIYGLVLGSILTLGAIGISLIFGILRFAHFAHGDMMALGAFLALPLVHFAHADILVLANALGLSRVMGQGVLIIGSALIAAVGVVIICLIIDFGIYRKLRHVNPIILLISSFGMALVIRAAIQMIWGPGNQVFFSGIQRPIRFGDYIIKPDHLWIMGSAVVLVVLLHLFLTYSKIGKAMRAMSDNVDLALVSGIPAQRVVLWTWIIGGGLAAIAGVFLGLDTRLHPNMGWSVLLPMFAACILGGIGKPDGASLGGRAVGVSMEMSTLVIDTSYKHAVAFAIMVVMLIVRPQGLAGGK